MKVQLSKLLLLGEFLVFFIPLSGWYEPQLCPHARVIKVSNQGGDVNFDLHLDFAAQPPRRMYGWRKEKN